MDLSSLACRSQMMQSSHSICNMADKQEVASQPLIPNNNTQYGMFRCKTFDSYHNQTYDNKTLVQNNASSHYSNTKPQTFTNKLDDRNFQFSSNVFGKNLDEESLKIYQTSTISDPNCKKLSRNKTDFGNYGHIKQYNTENAFSDFSRNIYNEENMSLTSQVILKGLGITETDDDTSFSNKSSLDLEDSRDDCSTNSLNDSINSFELDIIQTENVNNQKNQDNCGHLLNNLDGVRIEKYTNQDETLNSIFADPNWKEQVKPVKKDKPVMLTYDFYCRYPKNRYLNHIFAPKQTKPDVRNKNSDLPPCRICGEQASGLHFGVNSCEACNEFYRRSLRRNKSYKCSQNNKCDVTGKRRNQCAACRFKKCNDIGMCKERIKTGRYSHSKKMQDKLEKEEVLETHRMSDDERHMEKAISHLSRVFSDYHYLWFNLEEDVLTRVQLDFYRRFTHGQIEQCDHYHKDLDLGQCISQCPQQDTNESGYGALCQRLHMCIWESWLTDFVRVVKQVPGFRRLTLADQAQLLRASMVQSYVLNDYRGSNSSLGVLVRPSGYVFHYDELVLLFGAEYCSTIFRLSEKLKRLKLSPSVEMLVKVIAITNCTDFVELEDKEKAEQLNWFYLECLIHELSKRQDHAYSTTHALKVGGANPNQWKMFSKIMDVLTEMRDLNRFVGSSHFHQAFKHWINKEGGIVCDLHETNCD